MDGMVQFLEIQQEKEGKGKDCLLHHLQIRQEVDLEAGSICQVQGNEALC